ncbi:endonuclease/exonuclease/phosphatase family protein [Membranicola marinus]|uniref:Endonuclease/exonuclease/phosphatase family protein n=1 Tax=Membranihabitans marinus TaxID=1227546 RepID=A0A953HV97_9BACT|nr:endonuclease/exonuclease/phosphatase family protein [Membranihabitans marinus]MBY5957166.1 endonuclease/exonuclease/phosphatase family protein [Membranihabitans marinus]
MNLLRRIVIVINGVLIVSLILGYLRQFVHPGQASFLTIFSLLYPYLVIALTVTLAVLIVLRSKWLWATLLILVLTSGNTIRQIGFHFQPELPGDSVIYTISTLNVKNNFWHENQDQSSNFVLNFSEKDPTLLVLQEISDVQIRKVAELLDYAHGSQDYPQLKNTTLGIFSKHPLTNLQSIDNSEGRTIAVFADIQLAHQTIRLFNIHLHTNAVTLRAGKFSPESFSKKEGLRAFNDMLRAYNENASKRLNELGRIQEYVTGSPYPVIIAGDANDTPYSPIYRALKGNLQNGFERGGFGFAQTYNGLILPLKIDHIFMDNSFFIYHTLIEKIDYSDHNPITTSFSFKN